MRLKVQTNYPYFYAKKCKDYFITKGDHSYFKGHILPSEDEGVKDGIFFKWNWDGSKLIIQNDRYGLYPIFYYNSDREILVSPSIIKLIQKGASTIIDRHGLTLFFYLGYFLNEDTPFKHIKVVPPNAKVVWDGKLNISGDKYLGDLKELSKSDAIEQYIFLFRQAIQKRITPKEQFALPLSGGRDSRHILFELIRFHHRPDYCITTNFYPPYLTHDAKVASVLANKLKLRHNIINPILPRFVPEFSKNIKTHFCSDEHTWFLGAAEYMLRNSTVFYDGIGGEVLSASYWQNRNKLGLYRQNRLDELAEDILGRDLTLFERILPSDFIMKNSRTYAKEILTNELKNYSNCPNPLTMFHFWNRTRREVALQSFGLCYSMPKILCPYLDHEVFNFLVSLPPLTIVDTNFHDDTLRQAYPEHAHIPYDGGWPSQKGKAFLQQLHLALNILNYANSVDLLDMRRVSDLVRQWYRRVQKLVRRGYHPYLYTTPSWFLYILQIEQLVNNRSIVSPKV